MERSNQLEVTLIIVNPGSALPVAASPGQYAVGVQVIGGTAAVCAGPTDLYDNGFRIPSGVFGVNTASAFYLAASAGGTASIQVMKTLQGVSLRF